MPEASPPGPTPSGYQRTTGGNFHWKVPSVEIMRGAFPQYDILGLQGQGGMGAVFRAWQKSLDRLVAIKVLPQGAGVDTFNFAERFKNEARTMARLNHPGIVHVHDFGETADGLLFFVMEFVEGTDVQQLILQQRQLPPSYALPIAAHVCDALAYAHTHGVIHRDIKPANVMLTRDGAVKVADFGLAKLDDPTASSLTQTNMTMGTPDYVAPEALLPGSMTDARADLYAVGVMIYHMLMGEVPRGMFDLPGQRIPGSDPRIDAVITKAMKQRPEERYQTAAELRADLDAILTTPAVISGGASSAALPRQVVEASHPPAATPLQPHGPATSHSAPPRKPLLPIVMAAAIVLGPGIWLLLPRNTSSSTSEPPQPATTAQKTRTTTSPILPTKAPVTLDEAKWLPLAYPVDFGKLDGGVTQAPDGSVHLEGGFGRRLRARWGQADVAVRARVQIPADGVAIIGLRTDMNKPALRVVIHPKAIEIVHEPLEDKDASDHDVLCRFDDFGSSHDPVKGVLITAAVLGDQCLVWLDQSYLGSVRSNTLPAEGKILFDGINTTFHNMQWQVIGNTTIPVPPALQAEDITGVWSRPDNSSRCILHADGRITLINKDGQEDRRADGTPRWNGWRWRIETGKALLHSAGGLLQEEWSLTQPGVVTVKDVIKGSASTSKRSSSTIPAITSPAVLAKAPSVLVATTTSPKSEIKNQKSSIPAELKVLQATYAAAIAERVSAPHEASMRQLNTGYLAALQRAVTTRQLTAAAIKPDQDAITTKAPLPPDIEGTPEALATLRATYRAKATEYDDTRTTAHLALLTPYITKLRELEADLTQKNRPADAAAVTTYREALGQNPLALPEPAKP